MSARSKKKKTPMNEKKKKEKKNHRNIYKFSCTLDTKNKHQKPIQNRALLLKVLIKYNPREEQLTLTLTKDRLDMS